MARRCCLWINLSLYLQERGSLPDPCIVSDSQTQAITVFFGASVTDGHYSEEAKCSVQLSGVL
ncbi:uncharacterized protein [Physcomitrium patens]|uniref:uncharacterized protein isoform X4 n=1 Tax=Physcomitrium patens TaxID=3218 RepID=UPI003CCE4CA8